MKQDAWFLLGVGIIGMIHIVIFAGLKRRPKAHSIPVKEVKDGAIDKKNVFPAIQEAEKESPGVGLSLMPDFFPDSRRPNEETWMNEQMSTLETRKAVAASLHTIETQKASGSETSIEHLRTS